MGIYINFCKTQKRLLTGVLVFLKKFCCEKKQLSVRYILYIYVDAKQIIKRFIHSYLPYLLPLLTHEEIKTDFRGTLKSSFFLRNSVRVKLGLRKPK